MLAMGLWQIGHLIQAKQLFLLINAQMISSLYSSGLLCLGELVGIHGQMGYLLMPLADGSSCIHLDTVCKPHNLAHHILNIRMDHYTLCRS